MTTVPRQGRLWIKLDAGFLDDDKVVAAGERAAFLYIAMLCQAKRIDKDGVMTLAQIDRIPVSGVRARLAALVANDLVVELPEQPGTYAIAAWLDGWNMPSEKRAAYLQSERDRKAAKKGQANG